MGVALVKSSSVIDGIFHYKPTIFGDPPFMETPVFSFEYDQPHVSPRRGRSCLDVFGRSRSVVQQWKKNLHLLIK